MNWLKQSTAVTVKIGPFVDSTDGNTAETALTIAQASVRLSKNGGDMAAKNESTTCTHDELGYYDCPLDTTDTATPGRLRVMVHVSGALPVWAEFLVIPAAVYDSLVLGTDYLPGDAVQISGDSTAADNLEAACDGTTYNLGGGAVVAASVTGAVGSVTGAVGSVTGGVTVSTNTDKTGYSLATAPPTAAEVADAVLDEAMSGHTSAGTLGKAVADVLEDTGTTLPTTLATIDGIVDSILEDTGTTLPATLSTISGYVDCLPASWVTVPTAAEVRAEIDSNSTQLAAIVADTNELQTDWHDGGRLDLLLDGASAPTAAAVADAVWDEALSGHLGAGSTGYALNAAGSSGDPWATSLPGAYSAGSAGYILGTNLNATVSSRSTQTSVDTIDGIVDSILEDTGTTLPATLATIDGIVDAIVLDTAEIGTAGAGLTSIPWNAAWDAEVQSAAADALAAYDPPTNAEMEARTLAAASYAPASTALSNATWTDARAGYLDSLETSPPTAEEIADAVLGRNVSNVEASAPEHSLCTIILATLEGSITDTTWTIKRTDGTTTHVTKTVTTDADAEPITGVS